MDENNPPASAPEEKIEYLKLADIRPSPLNPRQHFDEDELAKLAEDIKAKKRLIQPIRVRRNADGTIEIVVGERRYRACKLLGWETIPCIVCQMDDRAAYLAAYAENAQRVDLTPLENARAFQRMQVQLGMSLRDIAAETKTSHQHVSKRLMLLQLIGPLQTLVERNAIDLSLAEQVAKWNTETQNGFAETTCADLGIDITTLPSLDVSRAHIVKKRVRVTAKKFPASYGPFIDPEEQREAARRHNLKFAAREVADAIELIDGKARNYTDQDRQEMLEHLRGATVTPDIIVNRLQRATEFLSSLAELAKSPKPQSSPETVAAL